jgi:glycosyltransferase involved in cell wall biosynthesis
MPEFPAPQELPSVSVIIPAFNEAALITSTLRALADVDYPAEKVEVIVVDNGSTDRTRTIAEDHGATVLVSPGATVAGLRNLGASRSTGAVLAFLDADCLPVREWLTRAVESLRAGAGVTGSRVAAPEQTTWVERAWFQPAPQGRQTVSYINSGNLIVGRPLFEALGGFSEALTTGEDSEFCRRARVRASVIADEGIRVVHLGNPKTLRQFLRREMWHGLGALEPSARTIRNKPLMGAIAFVGLTIMQVAGAALWAAGRGPTTLLVPTAALIGLVGASALQRTRWPPSPGLLLQLSALYYVYYLGRALALVRVLARDPHARRVR